MRLDGTRDEKPIHASIAFIAFCFTWMVRSRKFMLKSKRDRTILLVTVMRMLEEQ